jgi:hypothetical protein
MLVPSSSSSPLGVSSRHGRTWCRGKAPIPFEKASLACVGKIDVVAVENVFPLEGEGGYPLGIVKC